MARPTFLDVDAIKESIICCDGHSIEEIEGNLSRLDCDSDIAFDIETSVNKGRKSKQIRPYGHDPEILSIAFSDGQTTVAVAMDHPECRGNKEKIHEVVHDFLKQHTPGRRIAHNLSYELEWFGYFHGAEFLRTGLWGDTMAQAYLLGVPPGALSLDARCLANFGIRLKALTNVNVTSLRTEKLINVLTYNGLDAFFTKLLHDEQAKNIQQHDLSEVYEEQIRRVPTIVLTQLKGLYVDQKVLAQHDDKLSIDIEQVLSDLKEQKDIQEYEANFRTFNPGSDLHCVKFFRDFQNKSEGYRGPDSYSTDKTVLEKIGTPTALLIAKYRELTKLKSTYIEEYKLTGKNIWPDGRVHTNYNSCFVATRRLSSSNPNVQNAPKRSNAWIRSQFAAPKGHLFVSCDYGQIEARVVAMASKDENFIKALWDEYDIHMNYAEVIASMYPKALEMVADINKDKSPIKNLRQEAKNKFVFPALYGAGSYSISENFGIPKMIIEELLEQFWDQFSGVKKWQNHLRNFYRDNGYVQSLTGYRRFEPLEASNAVINTSIQGTASDIVVDAMNRLSEHAYKTNRDQFQPVLNIHDDLSFYLPEETLEDDLEQIITIMLDCQYSFVNVPLVIEVEAGPDWYHQEEISSFSSNEWL